MAPSQAPEDPRQTAGLELDRQDVDEEPDLAPAEEDREERPDH